MKLSFDPGDSLKRDFVKSAITSSWNTECCNGHSVLKGDLIKIRYNKIYCIECDGTDVEKEKLTSNKFCKIHFIELSLTGACGYCDY